MNSELPDRRLAQEIIDCMGESGQPPEHGLEFVTVGLDSFLEIIEHEYLGRLLGEAGGSAFRLVEGSYGAGKTHFLRCVRSIAQRLGFLTCSVDLSPAECPYEDAVRVYRAAYNLVSYRFSSPPTDTMKNSGSKSHLETESVGENHDCARDTVPSIQPEILQGFTNILRYSVQGKLPFPPLKSLEDVPVENFTFRLVCQRFMDICRQGGREDEELVLEHWLGGSASYERGILRQFGIYDDIASDNAMPILRSMVSILTALGFPGVIFLFDEVDRQSCSASVKHLQAIGDTLRQLIDLCASSRLPRVMFFYAAPPEFMRLDVASYPALQQRLARPLNMSRSSPQSVVINLEEAMQSDGSFFRELGRRLAKAAVVAWDWQDFDAELLETNLGFFVNFMLDHVFTGGYRSFVKFWIAILYRFHSDGQRRLTEDDLSSLLL